jgi:adenosylcobinamide-GDP ribazoletransferase
MTAADEPADEPDVAQRGREPSGRNMSGLFGAVTMFTVLPIPAGARLDVDRRSAARSLLWLPAVGAGLGLLAGVPLVATGLLVPTPTGAVLGAALAVATLAVATRGLHLDGLADTVDGLGSSTEAGQALAVMRKPDIGAFGVVAVVLLLLVKVAALAAATGRGLGAGVAGLVVAELVGRVGVVLAAARGIPSARPEGFGALVAGTVGRPAQVIAVAATVGIAAFPLGWGGQYISVQLLAAVFVGLAVAIWWRRRVVRRIGGVTGDVFGSVVELSSVAALVAVAVTG